MGPVPPLVRMLAVPNSQGPRVAPVHCTIPGTTLRKMLPLLPASDGSWREEKRSARWWPPTAAAVLAAMPPVVVSLGRRTQTHVKRPGNYHRERKATLRGVAARRRPRVPPCDPRPVRPLSRPATPLPSAGGHAVPPIPLRSPGFGAPPPPGCRCSCRHARCDHRPGPAPAG